MLSLALALRIPPHGRVNYHCYPVYNGDKLDVVWNEE